MRPGLRPGQHLSSTLLPRRGLPRGDGSRRAFGDTSDVAQLDVCGRTNARASDWTEIGETEETFVLGRPIKAVARCAKFDRRAGGIDRVAEEHATVRGGDEHRAFGRLALLGLASVRMVDHGYCSAPENPRGAGRSKKHDASCAPAMVRE